MDLNRKQRRRFFIAGLVSVVLGSIVLAAYFGEVNPPIMAGQVAIDPALESRATGLRTLFIVLYDRDSSSPLPWAAFQMRIRKDAKGTFARFNLTPENVQMMPGSNSNARPKFFRLKVRLDADGMGGSDALGDIVGELASVTFGETQCLVTLSRPVESSL